jgi:hypothetical protein
LSIMPTGSGCSRSEKMPMMPTAAIGHARLMNRGAMLVAEYPWVLV